GISPPGAAGAFNALTQRGYGGITAQAPVKSEQQIREEAAQIYQVLQQQGVNYVTTPDGQKIELYQKPVDVQAESSDDWMKKNPGFVVSLGLINPITWASPGWAIRLASIPRELHKLEEVGKLVEAGRIQEW